MLTQIPYDRELSVSYARRWALSRNPLFYDFTGGGGNCTSFVSQCLLAGCSVMDFTTTFGWYYRNADDRAPAWSSVEALYDFLTSSNDFANTVSSGPFAVLAMTDRDIAIGDVIQLANETGDFYHTLLISGFSDGDILVCAHSNDALDRPLSTYNFTSARVLHILGARIFLPREEASKALTEASALQTVVGVVQNATEKNS